MKKIVKLLFCRFFVVFLLIIIQLSIVLSALTWLQDYNHWVYLASLAISIIIAFIIIGNRTNPSYKIIWLIVILAVPLFGGILYLILGNKKMSKNKQKKYRPMNKVIREMNKKAELVYSQLQEINADASAQSNYIQETTGYPIFQNSPVIYYPSGEKYLPDLIRELEKAEKYIFMEYFIIEKGEIWDKILELLERKAKAGIDVRIIYDDLGCIDTLPGNYYKKLRKKGIKAFSFNRFFPLVNARLNNRDHRKICVIDGLVGFTGGVNLADEYFNKVKKYGFWKDNAMMIKGDAVKSLTLMFISFWDVLSNKTDKLEQFIPVTHNSVDNPSAGFVQPYVDNPLDDEAVGENVYLNLIGRAKKYLYITTPYLVIDNEMIVALSNAAKQGIDVRIVTPHHPDKRTVFSLTRSFYLQLVEAGVKIYEYTPGFVHQKVFLADDDFATVGTINLDFRSLYLHFENGIWLFHDPVIKDIKADLDDIISKSELMTIEKCKTRGLTRIWQSVLRAFAPML
ncbi:MAG: cardiolipin synthase [Firmicutes bacterium]|nr:cardiolipin synthase [Bacillota bacterium]